MAISARIQAMIGEVTSARELNYTTHISPELGFIYFATPACGCSTLKAMLNRATARALDLPLPSLDFKVIHDREANPLKRPRDIGMARFEAMLADPDVVKFAFIRDPAARLRSAFAKKLRRPSPFTRKVRVHLGQQGPKPPPYADADAFAAAVAEDPGLLALDEHWRPQRRQVFFDHVPDLQICFLEDFDRDVPPLFDGLFGGGGWEVVDAVGLNPGNSADNRKAPPLSAEALAAVRKAYAGDYAMIDTVRARRGEETAAPAQPAMQSPVQSPAQATAPAPVSATEEKLRLILHIGMGKTGTSAVQAALAKAQADGRLAKQRAAYLGMWFALPDGKDGAVGWERNSAFLRRSKEQLAEFGTRWGEALLEQAKTDGVDTFLLSNESLVGAAPAMAALLGALKGRFAISAICYVRDPYLWLPSAYAQWGIRDRHKGGEPDDFITGARRVVRHYKGVLGWHDLLPEFLTLRGYDGVADIVTDFAQATGLLLPKSADRVWASPEPAEQLARLRYSAGFPDRIAADRFEQRVLADGRNVPSIEALIARHLDPSDTEAVVAENGAVFDRIASECGVELRGAGGKRAAVPDSEALRARLLDYLLELTLDQARRIEVLEEAVKAGAAGSGAPKRSGS